MQFITMQKPIRYIIFLSILGVSIYIGLLYWTPSVSSKTEIRETLLLATESETFSIDEQVKSLLLHREFREKSYFDLPKCRPNVHFAFLTIYLTMEFPRYINHFLSTVVRNPSIDMLILASGNNCIKLQTQYLNTNIYISCVDRQTVFFFITDGLCSEWKCNTLEFEQTFKYIEAKLSESPYRIVDMKPMMGSLFREYLSCYTHWAFGDSDVWLGNFDKLYPTKFASEYDIITFPYGDYHKLFMRGQLTVFKNIPRLVSLWTTMTRFSSYKAFRMMIGDGKWQGKTITEGDFSATIVDNEDVTWIQLPGYQVQDQNLGQSETEVTVSIDQPPALMVRRSDQIVADNKYTKLNKKLFRNKQNVEVFKGPNCQGQGWIIPRERRCIKITENLSKDYGTVVMRSKTGSKISTATASIGTEEFLLFHFQNSKKKAVDWSAIPLVGVYWMNVVDSLSEPKIQRNKTMK